MGEKIRLNRYIARSGFCSRRRADELILKGVVEVNGKIVKELGVQIDAEKDIVVVQGKRIDPVPLLKKEFTYIAIYKPIKVVTTLFDPQKRRTIKDILPNNLKNIGLVPVGRLDYFSEGLLILSNDGDFVYKMTHPKFHLPKMYLVEVKGAVTQESIDIMKKGMKLEDINYQLAPTHVEILKKYAKDRFLLKFTLMQGINRQIRRMCDQLQWKVLKLKRVMHGPIKLGKLRPGEFRFLTKKEINECIKLSSPY